MNYDDPDYVTANAQVQGGLTAEGVRWALTAGVASNWHPLTWLSHQLDVTLFGLDPRGQDIISLRPESQARRQEHRENLAKIACITAIGGDERADFDERFRYLKNPAAGADLDKVIGDGWFLIDPVFPVDGEKTK